MGLGIGVVCKLKTDISSALDSTSGVTGALDCISGVTGALDCSGGVTGALVCTGVITGALGCTGGVTDILDCIDGFEGAIVGKSSAEVSSKFTFILEDVSDISGFERGEV